MNCIRCGKCCIHTRMQLTQDDIRRIEKLGFKKKMFVKYDSNGFAKLKNRKGSCIFYNDFEKKCIIYDNRPIGCKLYPIIYDIQKHTAIVDQLCPSAQTVTRREIKRKQKLLISTVEQLFKEAEERKNIKKQKTIPKNNRGGCQARSKAQD
ncbi:MAG: YkgJ family cysteine cluster protein [Nitrososphaeria archaeon]